MNSKVVLLYSYHTCEKQKNKHNSTNSIRSNPKEVPTSDPKEISNNLNKYFATVGSKLASKIPQTINTFYDYLDPPLNHTFFFDPIIPEDIKLEISVLRDNKALGLYSSPVRLLKLYAFFTRIGAQIWNSIPYSIKILKRSSFCKKIKELLLNFLWSEDDYVEVSRLIKLFNTLG